MLIPEVLKCHEDLITLDTYVQQGKTMDNNKFYIYVKTLTYLAIIWGPGGGGGGGLGPSWFTYTLYLIIIYMSKIEAI